MAKFYTVKAGNVKTGVGKPKADGSPGNPWIKVGLVIKSGPEEGKWLNYFLTITPKTKERVKRDLATMGITDPNPESFACDGRLFCAVWDFDDFYKEERVRNVIESKFQGGSKQSAAPAGEDEAF